MHCRKTKLLIVVLSHTFNIRTLSSHPQIKQPSKAIRKRSEEVVAVDRMKFHPVYRSIIQPTSLHMMFIVEQKTTPSRSLKFIVIRKTHGTTPKCLREIVIFFKNSLICGVSVAHSDVKPSDGAVGRAGQKHTRHGGVDGERQHLGRMMEYFLDTLSHRCVEQLNGGVIASTHKTMLVIFDKLYSKHVRFVSNKIGCGSASVDMP